MCSSDLLNQYEEALPYFEKAAAFFEIQNNNEFVHFIREKIDKLKGDVMKGKSQKKSTSH